MAELDSEKYREWILDTIDQLRKRKARPDLERICHMVHRKHGPSFSDIAAALDKLVETQAVVKVDYKGSTSYRNAAKWRKSNLGNVQNSASASAKLEAAVKCLTYDCSDGECGEVGDGDSATTTKDDIERWLIERDADTKLVKETLQLALDREVEAFNLERTAEGKYILPSSHKKTSPSEKSDTCKNGTKLGASKPKAKPQQQQKTVVKKLPVDEASNETRTREMEKKEERMEEYSPTPPFVRSPQDDQNNILDMSTESKPDHSAGEFCKSTNKPAIPSPIVSPSKKGRLSSTKRKVRITNCIPG